MYTVSFTVGQRLSNTWKVPKKWSQMIISINDTEPKKPSDSRSFEKQAIILGTASHMGITSQSPQQPLWKHNRLIQQKTSLEVPFLFSFSYFQLPQSSAISYRLTKQHLAGLPLPIIDFFFACFVTP